MSEYEMSGQQIEALERLRVLEDEMKSEIKNIAVNLLSSKKWLDQGLLNLEMSTMCLRRAITKPKDK